MTDKTQPKGYVGKILRINLTTQTTSEVSTFDYAPKFTGGKAIGTKIFYDEVPAGTAAFDPENELIFMTGPALGTGLPNGGRATFVSIAPNSYPEQYAWSGIGGYFGLGLKYAGYDGFIIEGKAAEPTYVYINDDKVEFCSAEPIWGELVHPTQRWIFDKYDRETYSLVIGPAGENLCRNASITTSGDNVAAKSGFGAVMGAKNLKAVAVHGTGDIEPGNLELVLKLRKQINEPNIPWEANPVTRQSTFQQSFMKQTVPEGWDQGWLSCCPGCTMRCNLLILNTIDTFTGETINQVEKCVSPHAYGFNADYPHNEIQYMGDDINHQSIAQFFFPSFHFIEDDPQYDLITATYPGNHNNFWNNNWDRGNMLNQLLNEYGLDKWDILIWYLSWISGAKQEGLLKDFDFGMEPDVENPEFLKHFIKMVVYREGIGDVFAEGMARAIRTFGKQKYGDAIYHNYQSAFDESLDIPLSQEVAWGQSPHWQGRGYQTLDKYQWVQDMLQVMVSTRDSQSNAHQHGKLENFLKYQDDPCHSQVMAHEVFQNDVYGDIKESILSCDWTHHQPWRSSEEAQMFEAATGIPTTEQEMFDSGVRSKLVMRAIIMRNYGRDRDLEVEEAYEWTTWPDPWFKTCDWDEWNDAVDLFYTEYGFDLATGWPLPQTWKKYDLEDIAADMKSIGKLPPEGGATGYKRKESPFEGHYRKVDPWKKAGDLMADAAEDQKA